jgi:hypothetical protein
MLHFHGNLLLLSASHTYITKAQETIQPTMDAKGEEIPSRNATSSNSLKSCCDEAWGVGALLSDIVVREKSTYEQGTLSWRVRIDNAARQLCSSKKPDELHTKRQKYSTLSQKCSI